MVMQYDGTAYHGFSRQKNAHTVQAEMEGALSATLGERVRVVPAGRTDAGVHALGQVVTFRTLATLPAPAIERALNARLPDDIVIVEAAEASRDFHARRSARRRCYRYTIWRGRQRNVWWRWYSHHVPGHLDVYAMRQASRLLIGRHDFRAFTTGAGKDVRPGRSTVRRVDRANWTEEQDFLYFDVCADGFLRQMVRGIVGTLLWVGRGKMPPTAFADLLTGAERVHAGPNAPARGLVLMQVEYESA